MAGNSRHRPASCWAKDIPLATTTTYEETRQMQASLYERVRGEFNEMPGLQLTIPQAARLWGLDTAVCRRVIDALVDAAFLRWTPAGTVVRSEK
jgi:hypothetical protein